MKKKISKLSDRRAAPPAAAQEIGAPLDPEKLQAATKTLINVVRTARTAMQALKSWAETIDWKALNDGRFTLGLVQLVGDEVNNRDDLSEAEKRLRSAELVAFQTDFAELIANEMCEKKTALRLIERALLIGYSAGIPADGVRALYSEIESKRSAIEKAHRARRAENVQEIIERLASALWVKKPSFKTNSEGTAKEISALVCSEISGLPEIPTGWDPPDSTDKAGLDKAAERIRKRIDAFRKRTNNNRPLNSPDE